MTAPAAVPSGTTLAFGDRDISINSSARSLASFRKLAANPVFNVQIR